MKRYLACGALMALTFTASPTAWAFTDSEARQAILELRQQLRTLTETSQRASLQLAERIDMLELEISRLRAMVEEMGGRPAGSSGSQSGTQQERAQDSKEQSAFDGAVDLYRQEQYKEAASSLSAFMTLYPNSVLAPTALFYLGSSQYAVKNYKQAISVLRTMAGKYPQHARAADALLVVAASQFELGDRAGSKATLEQIVKQYGSSAAAQTAQKRLKLF